MTDEHEDSSEAPLFSNVLLLRVTAFIGLMAVLTALLSILGKFYGDRLALDGQTTSTKPYRITIGQDILTLPANVIRFEDQRRDGEARTLDLYLTWPELDGYTQAEASRFSTPNSDQGLVFIEISQSVMSRDMSGRVDPIYTKLFKGQPEQGPAGLVLHHLEDRGGFGPEVLLTGKAKTGNTYAVRCIIPPDGAPSTSADCQRDIHIGRDLSLLYRFSSRLLPQWDALDSRILDFANRHLQNGS